MPKGLLEFNLPEEQEEFLRAVNAGDFVYRLHEFDMWLRSKIKYAELPEAEHAIYELVRKELYEHMGGLEF